MLGVSEEFWNGLRKIFEMRPLHFVLGGFLAWWIYGPTINDGTPENLVTLDPVRMAVIRNGWRTVTGIDPQPQEMEALERQEIDNEILFREGIALSLHELDSVVQQRLIWNMRFMWPDEDMSDSELLQQALNIGMHYRDVVVRRRIIQLVEMILEAGVHGVEQAKDEPISIYDRYRHELDVPDRWQIEHVYFSLDRRDDDAERDAREALRMFTQSSRSPKDDKQSVGDAFPGGLILPLLTHSQLASEFGTDFSELIQECELQKWCGPIRSSFGVHLVFVHAFSAGHAARIDAREMQEKLRIMESREYERLALERSLENLRRQYGVDPHD